MWLPSGQLLLLAHWISLEAQSLQASLPQQDSLSLTDVHTWKCQKLAAQDKDKRPSGRKASRTLRSDLVHSS